MFTFDFQGIASLCDWVKHNADLVNTEADPDAATNTINRLLSVADVWCLDVLNPVKSRYDWQAFSDLFTELGYTDLCGAFGGWALPPLDSEFWTNQGTIEQRVEQYYKIKAQGGPKPVTAAPVQQNSGTVAFPGGQQQAGPQRVCEQCNGTSISQKTVKNGPNTGRQYWGCNTCRRGGYFAWVS